jgi:hypothetical protein
MKLRSNPTVTSSACLYLCRLSISLLSGWLFSPDHQSESALLSRKELYGGFVHE